MDYVADKVYNFNISLLEPLLQRNLKNSLIKIPNPLWLDISKMQPQKDCNNSTF